MWENIRDKCIRRDKRTCQRCRQKRDDLTAHHIIPRAEHGPTQLSNLITLCETCHNWVETELEWQPDVLKTRFGISISYPTLTPTSRMTPAQYIQPGYPLPGDKIDIWVRWVKNGRKGSKELFEEYGTKTLRNTSTVSTTYIPLDEDEIDELLIEDR